MKTFNKRIFTGFLLLLVASMFLPSCYKKFDPADYAPEFTINGFSTAGEIATSNLTGYWAFDGGLVDSISKNGGAGTGTSFVNGFKGQALQGKLNGYALADPATSLNSLSSFTLSFWVNTPPPATGIIGLFSLVKKDGFWGNIEMFFENGSSNTDGKIRTHLYNGTSDREFASNGVANLFDKWVNLTVSYDGATSNYKLYVNGSVVTNTTAAGFGALKVTNPGKIVFGTAQFMTTPSQTTGSGSQPWASFLIGQLDEVRLYNIVLKPEEINALVVLQGKGK